jgi:DNA repair protein RecN (Recombination protein N)
MLHQLRISNYALIKNLDISFDKGFSVITGETGAGKSILLGALGLVLGNRADSNVLLDKDKKCMVEACFDITGIELKHFFDDNELDFSAECIMRREINPAGKSRAFINDIPVTLNLMKELGNKLVDVHSQHESLQLAEANFQLRVIDDIAGNTTLRAEFAQAFLAYHKVLAAIDELVKQEREQQAQQDFIKFQFDELEAAIIQPGEYEELERRLNQLVHAEEIAGGLFQALQLLDADETAILSNMASLRSVIDKLKRYLPEANPLVDRCNETLIELKDISHELSRLEQNARFDPSETELVNQRIDLLNHLLHKHHVQSTDELIVLKNNLNQQLLSIEGLGDEIASKKAEAEKLKLQMQSIGARLTSSRSKASPNLGSSVAVLLQSLGMPHAQFHVEVSRLEQPAISGYDKVQFMFSANKGIPMEDMARIASGGEMSRLMLAIKSLLTEKKLLPTIIFDEIDTGVSGEIAGKVGRIMAAMAARMQLISITHLPQIAGKANHHFLVYKNEEEERTTSSIVKLDDKQRIEEIARMLSDDRPTDASRQAARELIVN